MNNIRLFMWGYQHLFQISAQAAAEGIFNQIDPNLEPKTFLIGIRYENHFNSYPVCLEPVDCGYEPELFSGIKELAKHLQVVGSEDNKVFADTGEQALNNNQEEMTLKLAIEKIIENEGRWKGLVSFCSWPILVHGYMVCVILQFKREAYEEHYSLVKRKADNKTPLLTSLLDAAINEYLRHCSRALTEPEPGAGLDVIGRDHSEIIRAAGKSLMNKPASAGSCFDGLHGLFDACNTISSMRYEGAESIGTIIIAPKGHPNVKLVLSLKVPISMRNYRAVRKLLEISTKQLSLISDSGYVYGLGNVIDDYNSRREDLFLINFKKHYTWELYHAGNIMMRVAYGQPSLPSGQIDKHKFYEDVKRIFSSIENTYIEKLWRLTLETAKQKHGTILVISEGAKIEAERLTHQSINIEPTQITPELVSIVTNIDGAVLISPNASCYSIGVILDGLASEKGDSSRGARYNSAVRYVESSKYPCLAVVVSEDGMINLVPNLKPKIKKSNLVDVVNKLYSLSKAGEIDVKEYNEALSWLNSHRFYLTKETCQEVNSLRGLIEERISFDSVIGTYLDFNPNPEMNDSYFFD